VLEIGDYGSIREVRLARPPANALTPEMVAKLIGHLEKAGSSSEAVIVSGRPGMFSGGLDVPTLMELDRDGMERFWKSFLDLMRCIAFMPVPTVFALTGHAPAGGIVLALFGDRRIMSDGNYKTGLNEVQVGLAVSGIIRDALARLIGSRPAEKILLSGTMLGPQEALSLGLVDELQPDPETTVTSARAWCEAVLKLPRNAMLLTRQVARKDLHGYFKDITENDVKVFVDLWFSEVTQATLRSLVERLKKK
jgi:enoyl-CoA hydratase/carnithine racemase